MTPPGLTCARCETHLYPHLARATDNGFTHTRCPSAAELQRAARAQANADRLEDVQWMAEHGEHLDGAAKRLGISEGGLHTFLVRAGHRDLANTMRRRNPRDHNDVPDSAAIAITRLLPYAGYDEKLARKNERRKRARRESVAA